MLFLVVRKYTNHQSIMKKALVISGGGSKGAFAGGVAEYLINKKKKDYDLFLGTSTGSLLVSHLALGMIDPLKELYTSVNQKDIFREKVGPQYVLRLPRGFAVPGGSAQTAGTADRGSRSASIWAP